MADLSVEVLAKRLVDSLLEETYFNKETLTPKVEAFIRVWVKKQDVAKKFGDVSPNKNEQRLKTIERTKFEVEFWRNILKELVPPEKMAEYYKAKDEEMKSNGLY